jgi:hypothetical protein
VQLEDDVFAAAARPQQASCDQALAAIGEDVEQAGGELGMGADRGEVGEDGR